MLELSFILGIQIWPLYKEMKKFLIKWFLATPLAAVGILGIGYGLENFNLLSIGLGAISLFGAYKLETGHSGGGGYSSYSGCSSSSGCSGCSSCGGGCGGGE